MHSSVIMFCGKGGVGKTTCAAATALKIASSGKNTLAISTDPTPSLGHIFRLGRCDKLTPVTAHLSIYEIGVNEVKSMWDTKFGHEVYDVFNTFVEIGYTDFIEFMSSILPGMRDEFMVDYIRELYDQGRYEAIIWDTAPLGQTLELLHMPSMLRRHLRGAPRIYSKLRLGNISKKSILDIIKNWETISQRDIKFLQGRVSFVLVTIPETLAVEQLDGVFFELGKYNLSVNTMLINNLMGDDAPEFFRRKLILQRSFVRLLHRKYSTIDIIELPMLPQEITGIERLKLFGKYITL